MIFFQILQSLFCLFLHKFFFKHFYTNSQCHILKGQKSYKTFFSLLSNCTESAAGDTAVHKVMAHYFKIFLKTEPVQSINSLCHVIIITDEIARTA